MSNQQSPSRPDHADRSGEPIIRCVGVVKRYGSQTVLDGIDLEVMPGETMVIMGGSGSGKSTLLRLMIGSFEPDAGRIELLGQNICGVCEVDLNAIRRRFGTLFQSGALFQSMTLAENIALPLREHTNLDPEIIGIQVMMKLEQVGLREHADKLPSQISGGMKKRAGLARALALDPKILFYDEPSAGLDPVTSAQIDQLIMSLGRKLGVTSVVVTHEMDSAFTIADRMAMLDKGKMIAVADRAWFERLRDTDEVAQLDETQRLIRQFLCGDPDGPLTERQDESDYAEALFGTVAEKAPMPSIEATR